MRVLPIFLALCSLGYIFGCSKNNSAQELIPIPNGDFENWNGMPILDLWRTNSCPVCASPDDRYIVIKDSTSYQGQFAAKFIRRVSNSWADNKFAVSTYPTNLLAYVKTNLPGVDSVSIGIELFKNMSLIGSGKWVGTSSISNYTLINIPVSTNTIVPDSAFIRIVGGKGANSEFWVDHLVLLKQE